MFVYLHASALVPQLTGASSLEVNLNYMAVASLRAPWNYTVCCALGHDENVSCPHHRVDCMWRATISASQIVATNRCTLEIYWTQTRARWIVRKIASKNCL